MPTVLLYRFNQRGEKAKVVEGAAKDRRSKEIQVEENTSSGLYIMAVYSYKLKCDILDRKNVKQD